VVLSVFVCVSGAERRELPPIKGEYLFTFKNSATAAEREQFKAEVASFSPKQYIIDEWDIGAHFHGFGAKVSEKFVFYARSHPAIDQVEPNQIAQAWDTCYLQNGATWGIDRIAEREVDIDGQYHYEYDGTGVDAYVVDTGINVPHVDFGGRATWGANFAGDGINDDCNGHGTHVAGTIGGSTYGVAKATSLFAVKVLGCSGSGSYGGIISGLEWVEVNYIARGKRPSVANMSLGGGASNILNAATEALVAAGVTVVVAAGNDNRDSCNYSPASAPNAITVGATELTNELLQQVDSRASYSNYGTCVDIFAPGSTITSDWIGSTTAIRTISGTSMASPHVAGAVAQFLTQQPSSTTAQVTNWIVGQSTGNVIDLSCGNLNSCSSSPNKLLYSSC
jgi:serine protease